MTGTKAASCAGKKAYRTFNEADKRAGELRREHDDVFEAYHCTHCNNYHAGHPSARHGGKRPRPTWED